MGGHIGSSTSRWSGHIAFVDTRHGLLDTVRENVEFKYVLNKHASESNSASKKIMVVNNSPNE